MDIMSALPASGPLPRGMSLEHFQAQQAADDKKAAINKAASDLLRAPRNDAAETSKARVREQIEAIKKRLTILKSLYAGNPREMAKALAQVFKELKAAIKDYKAALKSEMGSAGDGVTALPPEPAPAAEADDKPRADTDSGTPAPTPDVTAPYGAVETAAKTTLGEDGLSFTKDLRALVNWIEQKMLAPARMQKQALKPDKATDEAFKDVEEQLKALRKEMEDTDRDLKTEAPMAGMHLDIAA